MLTYALILLIVPSLYLLVRYPAECWIFLTVIVLSNYLRLININQIILVPVAAGISINFTDMVTLSAIPIVFFSRHNWGSARLKPLLIFLLISLVIVAVYSFLVLHSSLGVVGNRFRDYAVYLLIPALVTLLRKGRRLEFLIGAIFFVAVTASVIQVLEFMRGSPFTFGWSRVTAKHFSNFSQYDGVTRVWNRAMSCVMLAFSISALAIATHSSKKSLFLIVLMLTASAFILSLTRTLYIFAILALLCSFFLVSSKEIGKALKMIVGATVIGLILVVGASFTGFGEVGTAAGKRMGSIMPALTGSDEHTTMDDRKLQFEAIREYVARDNVPPILGIGITDRSVDLFTSDLGYINIVVNMGILGLVFILWWLFYLFRTSLFLWQNSRDLRHKVYAGAIFSSLPGILITGINFDYFTGPYFAWPAFATVLLETILWREAIVAGHSSPSARAGALNSQSRNRSI